MNSHRIGHATSLLLILVCGTGCFSAFQRIDATLVLEARRAIPRPAAFQEDEGFYLDEEEESGKSVFIGELIAIFPGFFIHGLGHRYAGDHATARRLSNMGQWGYLFTAVGGGIVTGAYFIDRSSDNILPVSMYVAGGSVGAVGLGYFFSAWILDIYDTPRAIRSGGRPWRFLREKGDIFDD